MTHEKAVDVLLSGLKCIERNNGVGCDHRCESCDLVMYTDDIKEAYTLAIAVLKREPDNVTTCKECKMFADKIRWCNSFDTPMSPNDFCSYVERR